MNRDRVQGGWKQFKGRLRKKWAALTDDPMNEVAGQREILAGQLQQAYGIGKEEANRQINDWHESNPGVANDNDEDATPRQVNARR